MLIVSAVFTSLKVPRILRIFKLISTNYKSAFFPNFIEISVDLIVTDYICILYDQFYDAIKKLWLDQTSVMHQIQSEIEQHEG